MDNHFFIKWAYPNTNNLAISNGLTLGFHGLIEILEIDFLVLKITERECSE